MAPRLLSSETSPPRYGDSFHDENDIAASATTTTSTAHKTRRREKSGTGYDSETSSLDSLLDEDVDDDDDPMVAAAATARLQPFDDDPSSMAEKKFSSTLDPQKWSRRKKMFVAVVIAFYTSVFYSGSSIFIVSVPGVMIQYGVTQERALLGLSLYVLSYGLGPLLWAPLTEVRWIGRSPVYIFTIVAFVLISFFTATTAVKSLFGFLCLRFLQGFFGSPCLANGGASMHDIFNEQELPYALGVWIAFAYAGPALGPALAAYPTEAHGWSFPMWFIAYLSVPACVLVVVLPETYLPKILYKKGGDKGNSSYVRIGSSVNHDDENNFSHHQNQRGHHHSNDVGDGIWSTLKDSLIKPVQISILDPSVNFVNIYTSFCYATYYTFFDALPITYMYKYGFNLTQVAMACTCIMLGCVVGSALYFWYIYKIANPAAALAHDNNKDIPQEERLKPALVAVCLIPLGILIFAYASNGEIHWTVGMSGIAIYSGAVFVILQCLCMYMLKSYPAYAASLFASNDACRSVLAAAAVHVGVPYYNDLGIVTGCTVLAGLSCLGIVGMFVLYYKGATLRAKSRFAVR